MERLMGKIIDVREVQNELDRAARDAKHGPAAVRAGRFVHRHAADGQVATGRDRRPAPARSPPDRKRPPTRR
jgi:hypothetical protein